MKILPTLLPVLALVLALASGQASGTTEPPQDPATDRRPNMELGAFSISLAVKDLDASRAFYGALGFEEIGGDAAQNWLIFRNGTTTIGLFQGMFERNIMTFNPGWDANAKPLDGFTDVREIQRRLKAAGLELTSEADEATSGPASLTLVDPDGNPVLFDQHVSTESGTNSSPMRRR